MWLFRELNCRGGEFNLSRILNTYNIFFAVSEVFYFNAADRVRHIVWY